MPGPYWAVKGKQSTTGRNPSGAAAPPPFDKGGRGRARSALIVHQERTFMKGCTVLRAYCFNGDTISK